MIFYDNIYVSSTMKKSAFCYGLAILGLWAFGWIMKLLTGLEIPIKHVHYLLSESTKCKE